MYYRLWKSISFYIFAICFDGVYYRKVSVCFPLVFLGKGPISCDYDEIKQQKESFLSISAKTAKWAKCPGLLRRGCSEQERDGRRGERRLELDA